MRTMMTLAAALFLALSLCACTPTADISESSAPPEISSAPEKSEASEAPETARHSDGILDFTGTEYLSDSAYIIKEFLWVDNCRLAITQSNYANESENGTGKKRMRLVLYNVDTGEEQLLRDDGVGVYERYRGIWIAMAGEKLLYELENNKYSKYSLYSPGTVEERQVKAAAYSFPYDTYEEIDAVTLTYPGASSDYRARNGQIISWSLQRIDGAERYSVRISNILTGEAAENIAPILRRPEEDVNKGNETSFSLSPDGGKVLVYHYDYTGEKNYYTGVDLTFCVFDVNGDIVVQERVFETTGGVLPYWTADGQKLLLEYNRGSYNEPHPNLGYYLIDLVTGEEKDCGSMDEELSAVLGGARREDGLGWAAELVYARHYYETRVFWSGQEQRHYAKGTFSPDKSRLVYAAESDGGNAACLMLLNLKLPA